MREIICDTNIWYGLGNQSIIKPKEVKLIATWINIIEIGFSHPEIKERLDQDNCRNAAKAILIYADKIVEIDPFAYATLKIDLDLNTFALLDSNKYSSPHAYAFDATIIPDLAFLREPSIMTTIF